MDKKISKTLFIVGLVFYIFLILWIIIFKNVSPLELFSSNRYFSRTLNLIPFDDILTGGHNYLDIWGNVLLFIPLGIYMNIIKKNSKTYEKIYKIAAISLLFEVSQYVFAIGASDITDIITNTTGGIIGMGIHAVITKIFKRDYKVKEFISICSVISIIPSSKLLFLIFICNYIIYK